MVVAGGIVEQNRRRAAEAAAALDTRELASPSDVAEFKAAGISVCIDESLRELRAARLDAIDRALEALARGGYGTCAR